MEEINSRSFGAVGSGVSSQQQQLLVSTSVLSHLHVLITKHLLEFDP